MSTDQTSCEDFRLSRRRFLATTGALIGGAAVSGMIGDVFTQTAYGAPGGNTLVVLSLRGGSDGLSMIVPHGDPGYARARPTIGLPTGSLLAKDSMFGLHPEFEPLLPMWQSGKFGAVQAVGMRVPNRSHFAAMEAVEDADPGSSARVGWLNRMIGLTAEDAPQEGLQLGRTMLPTALVGPASAVSARQLSDFRLPGGDEDAAQARMREALSTLWGGQRSATGKAAQAALDVSATMSSLAKDVKPANGATYPQGDLGRALAASARVIKAGVGVRVITLDYGGWDMHVGLGTVSNGDMKSHVAESAKAIAAFFTDLGGDGDKVTLVTMSEFGRRVEENGSGTDHGHGNAMLLFGAGVRGGKVHGSWPGLSSGKLIDGDLAVTTDYRGVLTEVIAARFPEVSTAGVFPGFTGHSPLGLMR
jgi:uncharacterized protein (DUF1501 family)